MSEVMPSRRATYQSGGGTSVEVAIAASEANRKVTREDVVWTTPECSVKMRTPIAPMEAEKKHRAMTRPLDVWGRKDRRRK